MKILSFFKKPDPRIIWWLQNEDTQNFGDYLGWYIWRTLSQGMLIEANKYHFIGSVISDTWINDDLGNDVDAKVLFWGCGKRDATPLDPFNLERSLFCGVRGPLTRDALKLPHDTTLGDPALLMPIIYSPNVIPEFINKLVCAPHIYDARTDHELLADTSCHHVLRPTVEKNIRALLNFIDVIYSSEFVLTGSLHAAIIAAAYNKPFCYMLSDNIDIIFKWKDFASSIGIEPIFSKDWVQGYNCYYDNHIKKINVPSLARILNQAPFKTNKSIILKAIKFDCLEEYRYRSIQ